MSMGSCVSGCPFSSLLIITCFILRLDDFFRNWIKITRPLHSLRGTHATQTRSPHYEDNTQIALHHKTLRSLDATTG
jgi:hypothetical protein